MTMPQLFGRYLLHQPLGAGAMGEVYLATLASNIATNKPCIVKRLRVKLKNNPHVIHRFTDEMQILANLHHPNLVNAFEFGEVPGGEASANEYYVAMEYVDGLNLDDLQSGLQTKKQTMPQEIVIYLLIHICRGLNYLHAPQLNHHGVIVHRDLAPQNILISRTGEIKIADFGLAKSNFNLAQSQDGTVKGHLRTMSPEQARGEPLGYTTDLFALGVIGFELATSRSFFELTDMNVAQSLQKIASYQFDESLLAPLQHMGELRPILAKLLATQATDRYQDTEAVLADLSQALLPTTVDAIATHYLQWLQPYLPPPIKIDTTVQLPLDTLAPPITKPTPPPIEPKLPAAADALVTAKLAELFRTPAPGWSLWGVIKRLLRWGLVFLFLGGLIVVALEEQWLPDRWHWPATWKWSMPATNITTPVTTPTLHVNTTPPGARLEINPGARVFYSPYTFTDLPADTLYTLVIQKPGYLDYREQFNLSGGEQKIIALQLKRKKSP